MKLTSDNLVPTSQAGMSTVVVTAILATLLSAGAVVLSLQLGQSKQTASIAVTRRGLYCAEAGLAVARDKLVANPDVWSALLTYHENDPPTIASPAEWYPVTGDIDEDGVDDFIVTIQDDGDGDQNPLLDANETIIVVSNCTKYPGYPAEVMEVIGNPNQVQGHSYRAMSGQGAGNVGNVN